MLLEDKYEVQKMAIVHKYNQEAILLIHNRQVGMCTKHINVQYHFMRNMSKEKYIDIEYIRRK